MQIIKLAGICALVALAAIVTLCLTTGANAAPSASDSPPVPKLFDFDRFKSVFKKSYSSAVESAVRQKLFLARAFRAFTSGFRYKFGISSYYLKINKMSDMTPEELDAMRMRNRRSLNQVVTTAAPIEMAEESDIIEGIKEIRNKANEAGFAEMAKELESVKRRRRQVESDEEEGDYDMQDLSMDDLMGSPDSGEESPEVKAKIKNFIPSNNPDYVEYEGMSYGMEGVDYEKQNKKTRKVGENYMEEAGLRRKNVKVKEDLADTAKKVNARRGKSRKKPKNTMYVDHRESGCFFKVRDQGDCGSCYAFATVALLEYLHCMETGDLVAFSEQYFLDCGARANLGGCDGSMLTDATRFPIEYGIELRNIYPYRERVYNCPYGKSYEKKEMGFIRPSITDFYHIEEDEFEEHLQYTPMIIGISIAGDFMEYGGGVHNNKGCLDYSDHAVLLVGSGRQNGVDYWLIRNSYSTSFGENGYYKLAKKATCIFDGAWFYGTGKDLYKLKIVENKDNDPGAVMANYEYQQQQRKDFESY